MKHVVSQCNKSKKIPADSSFKTKAIDLADTSDSGLYYGGLVFILNVASWYSPLGQRTATVDVAHVMEFDASLTKQHF